MARIDKELLLKDLCGRLSYGVKCEITTTFSNKRFAQKVEELNYLILGTASGIAKGYEGNTSIKPYLFPLSSTTEEQKYDFYCRFIENDCDFDDFKEFYLANGMWHKLLTSLDDVEAIIDWLHKNHFDYRGLIPMELAIDATDKSVY